MSWTGQSLRRIEDARLLTGSGCFMADWNPVPGARHAAVVRSPHARARIRGVDASEALRLPGVVGVLTGEDIRGLCKPFSVAAPQTVAPYYPLAVDEARFAGEPVALVVATDRYTAEDARDRIRVDYEPLPAVVDVAEAAGDPQRVALERTLVYGEPDEAFAAADLVVDLPLYFPKYTSMPLETYGVVASHDRGSGVLTVWCNFHGPFSMHPVVAAALGLPGNKLRFVVPADIGGAFGIKISLYPYIALVGLAARRFGCAVKWIEDRQEALAASSSHAERAGRIRLAARSDGEVTGCELRVDDGVGAYLRPPEPGCLFRAAGNLTGGYRCRNVRFVGRAVLVDKSPTGPNRGYGCQQLYFFWERAMDELARQLGLDPAEVRRRNLLPSDGFPYTTPSGGVYDSGDYRACLQKALEMAGYDRWRAEQARARQQGRLLGVGIACGVDPSVSNMGYIDLAFEPQVRKNPKSGASQSCRMTMDASGGVSVEISSTPQGQGHETVCAQIAADVLDMSPEEVTVISGMDTATRPWSVSTGAYASRFAAVGSAAVRLASEKLRDRLLEVAAHLLETRAEDLELRGGRAAVRGAPERNVSLRRIAGTVHWDPQALPEGMEPSLDVTATASMTQATRPDAADRVNSSAVYGFGVDVVVVEIDPQTFDVRIADFVSVHDAGRILNPAIAEGQVRGSVLHGLAGALYEELVYDPETGQFLSASLMDYACPTSAEAPAARIGHIEVPTPATALGSKGIGEASSQTTPAAVAGAVADALAPLGVTIDRLPIRPDRLWAAAGGPATRG